MSRGGNALELCEWCGSDFQPCSTCAKAVQEIERLRLRLQRVDELLRAIFDQELAGHFPRQLLLDLTEPRCAVCGSDDDLTQRVDFPATRSGSAPWVCGSCGGGS
ncbi:MAG: hypothetical protein ACYTFN_14815 [Planctomycetota bacterium]